MGFAMTPASGYPPPTPDEFPNFIQFQGNGTDLGGPDADTVNLRRGLQATRGTGENANVITVDSNVFTWRDVTEDADLAEGDLGNGLKVDSAASSLAITVPGDTELGLLEGDGDVSVLIMQYGSGSVTLTGQSGVTINVRSALTLTLAGQYAVASLIHTGPNEWVLCGDLAAAV